MEEVETFDSVQCPFCGEINEVRLGIEDVGSWVQDCEVCCKPWQVTVENVDGYRRISLLRN